jgi:hypothetical protein
MIDRRRILQGGLALSSLPLVATVSLSGARSAHAKALEHPSLYKVLFDQRFAESRDFGHDARMQGHSVQGFNGDITNVWYRDLHPRWKQGTAAIAGLTAHGALFCLERLAWDVGMRVTHRAEHRYEGHEPLYSWVIAPRGALKIKG